MERERWQRMEEIFSSAAEITGAEREAFLRRSCEDDDGILAEIRELLAEHANPSASLDTPVFETGLRVLDRDMADKRSGQTVGHFKFGRLIGRGGMGDIYEAEDLKLERKVAIKLVNELFALDPERIRRFRKEADAAARVSHPNVAKLYELCEIDGENLIVMEPVGGANLRHSLNEPMQPAKAIGIAIQIGSALAAAHTVGVVHRDIKPENIVITPDGTVKVLDFGLAKLVDPIGEGAMLLAGDENATLTVDMSTELGALIGTPAYMSPEQIRGANVDTQTDIWSLGVLLYEMLSGQLPFCGSTKIDRIAAVLISEPPPVRIENVAGQHKINAVLRKALCKEKTGRYRDAGEILADLHALKNDDETRPEAMASRHAPIWKYLTGIVVLITLVIAGLPASRRLIISKVFPPPPTTVPLQLPPVTEGLVSYWPANGDGTDAVGGNNGELLNGATYRPGVSGQAFGFDGVDDLFQAPTNGLPTGNSDRTLAMWVKADAIVAIEAMFGGYGSFTPDQAYFLGVSQKSVFISNWGDHAAGPVLEPEKWYYITATTSNDVTSLYVDGVLVKSSDFALETPAGTSFWSGSVSGEVGSIRKLNGAVDEILVYRRALSAAEIQTLFATHGSPNGE